MHCHHIDIHAKCLSTPVLCWRQPRPLSCRCFCVPQRLCGVWDRQGSGGFYRLCRRWKCIYHTFPLFFTSSSSSLPPARGSCRESILKRKCHKVKEGSRGKRKIYTFCLVLGNSRKPKYTHKNNSVIVNHTHIPLCQNHVVLIVHWAP